MRKLRRVFGISIQTMMSTMLHAVCDCGISVRLDLRARFSPRAQKTCCVLSAMRPRCIGTPQIKTQRNSDMVARWRRTSYTQTHTQPIKPVIFHVKSIIVVHRCVRCGVRFCTGSAGVNRYHNKSYNLKELYNNHNKYE